MPIRDDVQIYPDALELFKMKYQFGWHEPVFISDSGVVFDQLLITHDGMQLSIDGDLNAFELDFKNIDLTRLNQLYFNDTTVITAGHLNGMISMCAISSLISRQMWTAEPVSFSAYCHHCHSRERRQRSAVSFPDDQHFQQSQRGWQLLHGSTSD
ncbi:MAG: hypothetical protein IPN60_00005 [Saprospiraceae bacterium]|nr:hypothetical protein [Candidatus Opimibacter skivensis]